MPRILQNQEGHWQSQRRTWPMVSPSLRPSAAKHQHHTPEGQAAKPTDTGLGFSGSDEWILVETTVGEKNQGKEPRRVFRGPRLCVTRLLAVTLSQSGCSLGLGVAAVVPLGWRRLGSPTLFSSSWPSALPLRRPVSSGLVQTLPGGSVLLPHGPPGPPPTRLLAGPLRALALGVLPVCSPAVV